MLSEQGATRPIGPQSASTPRTRHCRACSALAQSGPNLEEGARRAEFYSFGASRRRLFQPELSGRCGSGTQDAQPPPVAAGGGRGRPTRVSGVSEGKRRRGTLYGNGPGPDVSGMWGPMPVIWARGSMTGPPHAAVRRQRAHSSRTDSICPCHGPVINKRRRACPRAPQVCGRGGGPADGVQPLGAAAGASPGAAACSARSPQVRRWRGRGRRTPPLLAVRHAGGLFCPPRRSAAARHAMFACWARVPVSQGSICSSAACLCRDASKLVEEAWVLLGNTAMLCWSAWVMLTQ